MMAGHQRDPPNDLIVCSRYPVNNRWAANDEVINQRTIHQMDDAEGRLRAIEKSQNRLHSKRASAEPPEDLKRCKLKKRLATETGDRTFCTPRRNFEHQLCLGSTSAAFDGFDLSGRRSG